MTNDLISRQAAKDAFMDATADGDKVEFCWWVLDRVPNIDPVKHGEWNAIKKRPMDEEERREWSERLGYDIEYEDAYIYTNLPDNGEEVLICYSCGPVAIDTFWDDDGCYFEDTGDMDGIVAWMPLPEPYKEGEREEDDRLNQ